MSNGAQKVSPDDVLDGYSARDVFEGGQGCTGFTYDDLIVLPGTFAAAPERAAGAARGPRARGAPRSAARGPARPPALPPVPRPARPPAPSRARR